MPNHYSLCLIKKSLHSFALLAFFCLFLSGCGCGMFGGGAPSINTYMKQHNQMAFDYYKDEDYDSAISEVNKVIEIDPGNAGAHFIMGLINYKRGNLEASQKSFAKAVSAAPNSARYRTNLALTYDNLGEHEEALKQHILAIKKDPKLPVAQNNIAECYYFLGRYGLAWKHLEKARALNYPVKGDFVKKVLNAIKNEKNK